MSKIGRKPIPLKDVKVEIKGQEVHFTGKADSGVHVLPQGITAELADGSLKLLANNKVRDARQSWGLHRALLNNKISGAQEAFVKQVKIVGLGYKAVSKGSGLEFALGYSHKIDFPLPKEVTVDIDKSGQLLTLKSSNRELVGKVAGDMRTLRPVEPYKGTGVFLTTDHIVRKAGKAKA